MFYTKRNHTYIALFTEKEPIRASCVDAIIVEFDPKRIIYRIELISGLVYNDDCEGCSCEEFIKRMNQAQTVLEYMCQ